MKVGDRIFFEHFSDNSIGDAIVTKIEPMSYKNHKGEIINYNRLYVSKNSCIEDYNCLPEDDPHVIEYKKTHADPRIFKEKFEQFMRDNNFDISQQPIRNYLYDILC